MATVCAHVGIARSRDAANSHLRIVVFSSSLAGGRESIMRDQMLLEHLTTPVQYLESHRARMNPIVEEPTPHEPQKDSRRDIQEVPKCGRPRHSPPRSATRLSRYHLRFLRRLARIPSAATTPPLQERESCTRNANLNHWY